GGARAEAPLAWGAVAGSAGLAAGVVLLQAVGLDPLGRFTPVAAGGRLALYGTLGNPDFVASVLGVTVPLTGVAVIRFRGRRAGLALGSAVAQRPGVAGPPSFATVLALAAAGAGLAPRVPPRGRPAVGGGR